MVTRLNTTDEAALQHVARYRMTLPRCLAHKHVLDVDLGTAHELLERLRKAGYLICCELTPEAPGTAYYQLTPKAARRLKHSEDFARPLKRDLRIEYFAILHFCCSGSEFRQLLTKNEFQQRFKNIWFPGQPVRYYLEPDGNGAARLAFPKVDLDGPGRWDRLIDSCARFLRKRVNSSDVPTDHKQRSEAFAQLVKRDRFQFSVLTALPEKMSSIELELARRKALGEPAPPIKAYVVPGLFDKMFPPPSKSIHR